MLNNLLKKVAIVQECDATTVEQRDIAGYQKLK